jgi:hypothetical protein
MSEELNDKDPFADDEPADEANYISEGMVRKATYLIHKLADQKGQDYKEIQKKCKKLFAYTNLAKVTLEDGHAIINKLIELTGGEEEKPQLPRKPDDGLNSTVKDNLTVEKNAQEPKEIKKQPAEKKEEEIKTGDDLVTETMRHSVRAAVDITLKEIVAKEVPVQGLGGVVLEISKVIFEAKMSAEAD